MYLRCNCIYTWYINKLLQRVLQPIMLSSAGASDERLCKENEGKEVVRFWKGFLYFISFIFHVPAVN